MVNLTRIYTRTGDDGTTALGDFSRTRKTDPRLIAYADVDEANSAIGVAVTLGDLPTDVVTHSPESNMTCSMSGRICALPSQRVIQQTMATQTTALRVEPDYIERLEVACDHYNASLEPLRSFVLPGGTAGGGIVSRCPHNHAARGALGLGCAR